jgi:hypothetical protein
MAEALTVVLLVSFPALWLSALIAIERTPRSQFEAASRSRTTTLWVVFLLGSAGGLYYWLFIRRQVRHVVAHAKTR